MNLFDTDIWQEILITIRRNKWRSIMTAFGVFWGIWMFIVLSGCGVGISNGVMPDMETLPSNSVFIWPSETSLPYKGFQKGRSWFFKNDDVDFIKHYLGKKAESVSALYFGNGCTVSHDTEHGDFRMKGVSPSYRHCEPVKIIKGRYINDIDIRERRKVCVIGDQVYETLFPNGSDPCGSSILANGIYYTVIGVVKSRNDMMNIGGRTKETLILPISTMQQVNNAGDHVHLLAISLKEEYSASEYQKEISREIKSRHMIDPDDPSATFEMNLEEMVGTFKSLFMGINILLWIVGIGTLLAGLVGISNITLVTVKERTQEIGIRRALGAKPITILSQIMSESLVLTIIAGVSGLIFGIWMLAGLSSITSTSGTANSEGFTLKNPEVSFDFAIMALVIIIVGGLLAGLLPSIRAMKIKAIEALRDE